MEESDRLDGVLEAIRGHARSNQWGAWFLRSSGVHVTRT